MEGANILTGMTSSSLPINPANLTPHLTRLGISSSVVDTPQQLLFMENVQLLRTPSSDMFVNPCTSARLPIAQKQPMHGQRTPQQGTCIQSDVNPGAFNCRQNPASAEITLPEPRRRPRHGLADLGTTLLSDNHRLGAP